MRAISLSLFLIPLALPNTFHLIVESVVLQHVRKQEA